jgi:hypothetical protein
VCEERAISVNSPDRNAKKLKVLYNTLQMDDNVTRNVFAIQHCASIKLSWEFIPIAYPVSTWRSLLAYKAVRRRD